MRFAVFITLVASLFGCSNPKAAPKPVVTVPSEEPCEVTFVDANGTMVERLTRTDQTVTAIQTVEGVEIGRRIETRAAGVTEITLERDGMKVYHKREMGSEGKRTISIDDIGGDGTPGVDGEIDATIVVELNDGREVLQTVTRDDRQIVTKTFYEDGVKSKVERVVGDTVVERIAFTTEEGRIVRASADLGADTSQDLVYTYQYDDLGRLSRVDRTGTETGSIQYRYECH